MDYLDARQAPNFQQTNQTTNQQISINDFKSSNDANNERLIKWASMQTSMQANGMDAVILT